ncbi:MAG: beta-propeller fold lactonase family protein [Bacteroidota bacterium]
MKNLIVLCLGIMGICPWITNAQNSNYNTPSFTKKSNAKDMGALYVATNKTDQNSVVAIRQHTDGSLIKIGEYATGGKGTGNIEIFDWGYDPTHPLKDGVDPLISAYGITKTMDNKYLLAVNSGDASISSFTVQPDKSLQLNNVVAATDKHPLSIATHNNTVFVASSGDNSGSVSGYRLDDRGKLSPIKGSTRELKARPSCVAFTPDGKFIVVSELATGMIKVFKVMRDGSLSENPLSSIASPHDKDEGRWLPIPVGFDIVQKGNKHIILISEARFLDNTGGLREENGKVPQSPKYSWQTGSSSSYVLDRKGRIRLVSGDIMTGNGMEGGQIANCWVEASRDGRTLWAANALSSSISTYKIEEDGTLSLVLEKAYKKEDESLFFSDLYLSMDGKYLNQLIGNKGAIQVFEVQPGIGSKLKSLGMYSEFGIPEVGAYGLISL